MAKPTRSLATPRKPKPARLSRPATFNRPSSLGTFAEIADAFGLVPAEPTIEAGAVFDKSGAPFASYLAADAKVALPATPCER